MNIGLVPIAAFLLLLPGVAFIVGVNFADKNVREIVFRNTPLEIGYVIFISVFVHLIFAVIPVVNFYEARLYVGHISMSADPKALPSFDSARYVLIFSLTYFLVTALSGFLPGFALGRLVSRQAGRWVYFFVRHQWMLELIEMDPDVPVYARVVLRETFLIDADRIEKPIIVQGVLRDSYFGADGTLLYLVFKTFGELKADTSKAPCLDRLFRHSGRGDQLVIEGQNIAMARYYRRPLPFEAIESGTPEGG
jgi:hypothetical protein